MRKQTKKIRVGDIFIGGDAPISVQTMVKSDAHDVKKVIAEIEELTELGCDIVRMGVLDLESVQNIGVIKKRVRIPLVADIHFNAEFALEAIRQGVDKFRYGNYGYAFRRSGQSLPPRLLLRSFELQLRRALYVRIYSSP